VLDAGRVLPAALDMAHDIAENTAPMSVAARKRLLWDSLDLDREAVGARETQIHLRLIAHDDARDPAAAPYTGLDGQARRSPAGGVT
jgi:enoyl-CoA hydratase/carnithine racemase